MGFFTKKQIKLSAVAFNLDDFEELNYNQLVEVNGGCGGGFWAGVRNFFSGGKNSSGNSGSASGSSSASRGSSGYSSSSPSGSTSYTTSSSYGGCGGNVTKNSSGNKTSGNLYTDVVISYQKNGNKIKENSKNFQFCNYTDNAFQLQHRKQNCVRKLKNDDER